MSRPTVTIPTTDVWSRYDQFNLAIADEFFSGASSGRPVYLDLEASVLERIAAAAGEQDATDARAAFFEAVRPTLQLAPSLSVFGRHRGRRAQWRAGRLPGPPPHLAVLALLSLVAEAMCNDGQLRATAYYSRLIEVVGGDPNDEGLQRRIRAGHGRDVPAMWDELNRWLEEDPRRGMPTAFAFDYRTYIGPALTQALVREADRALLPEFFVSARLVPGQDLAQDDMVRLLREWLPTSRISKGLKGLCQSHSALERVADVALAELRSWNGAGGSPVAQTAGLRLAARIRRRPRPTLELRLLARGEGGSGVFEAPGTEEDVVLVADAPGEAAVSTANAALALSNSVVVRADGKVMARAPRRLVLLREEPDRARFVEVGRALLGERHMLLVREDAMERVQQAVSAIARPGWSASERVGGLPVGWELLTDVEIVALGEFGAADERNVLVPTAWSQMTLHGGFRLPGRHRWLASAPPELSISVLEGGRVDVTAHVRAADSSAVEDEPGDERLASPNEDDDAEGSAVGDEPAGLTVMRRSVEQVDTIDLEDLSLQAGRYTFVATRHEGHQVVARTGLELMCAAPENWRDGLGHDADRDELWPVGAVEAGGLRGSLIPMSLRPAGTARTPSAGAIVPETPEREAAEVDPRPELPTNAPECFRTGLHLFKLPSGRFRKGIHTACEHCGMEKFIPPKPPKKGGATQRRLRLPPLQRAHSVHEEHLLLGLSAVGSGGRRAMERLVEQADDAPWALDERARTMSALGHVDVAFDVAGRVDRWTISPPAIAQLRIGEAVVCGWRSERLVDALQHGAAPVGGLRRQSNGDGPDRLSLRSADPERLERVLRWAAQAAGVNLPCVDDSADRLARALPLAKSLVSALPPAHAPKRLEWLRPGAWEWEPCVGVRLTGAYRTCDLPRRSFFFDGHVLRSCEPRLARWLSVRPSTPHMAYDARSETLTIPLGGRLPGLWERAAVLCSGRTPEKVGGRLVYRDVSKEVAGHLARSLDADPEDLQVA